MNSPAPFPITKKFKIGFKNYWRCGDLRIDPVHGILEISFDLQAPDSVYGDWIMTEET